MHMFMYEPLANLIIEQLHIKPTDKVLDVGAATGGLAHTIWKRAGIPTKIFHRNQKDVGMAVANKVRKQVWTYNDFYSTMHCPT